MDKKKCLAICLSLALLNSCAPVVVAGAGGAVGATVTQDRTVKEISDDLATKSHIKYELSKNKLFSSIGVKVSEGRVLLTGKVPTYLDKLEAAKITWLQPGVKEVNNEIKVTSKDTKTVGKVASDSWITTELKSKLLVTKNVRSANYGFETIDGVVYILGIAQNKQELNEVIRIAKQIKGVEDVVSYARIKK
jgi:osmotically-inducible protein OsmY